MAEQLFEYIEIDGGIEITAYIYNWRGKEVVIPHEIDGKVVTSIGSDAFSKCKGITSVEIPSSVTSIGDSAFRHCSGLTRVEIANGVTSIGVSAFYECSGLTRVEIPSSVTSIGMGTFFRCSGLTRVEIPSSVMSIGVSAFYECSGLTSVEIPSSVTSIGTGAFRGCSGLRSVEIPSSVTSIGDSAFFRCRGLRSVEIPNSVTSIGDSAFWGCSGLRSVEIPNSVEKIGSHIFADCENLEDIYTENEYVISELRNQWITTQQLSVSLVNEDISEFKGRDIKAMCIAHLRNMKTDIPSDVLEIINRKAKDYLPELMRRGDMASITRALNVVTIKLPTITACMEVAKELNNAEIDVLLLEKSNDFSVMDKQKETMKKLNKNPYPVGKMKKLWEYEKDENNNITILAYKGDEKDINIPPMIGKDVVTSIGASAFSECSGLTSIEIPNSVTSIGNYAFEWCSGLTSIEIPNSVTSIGDYAFEWCSGLTSVEIPNSVTSIAENAFWHCRRLRR